MTFTGIQWQWAAGWVGIAAAICLLYFFWRGRHKTAVSGSQSILFTAGLLLLLFTFLPPLYPLGRQLFTVHMLQRLLLVSAAPFLLLRADPWPAIKAGLPAALRGGLPTPVGKRRRYWIRRLAGPQPVWFLFVCNYWLWYDGTLHQWSLNYGWLHQVELLLCFGTAGLYWWHILQVAPRLHPPLPPIWRVVYTALGAIPIKAAALILLFTDKTIYFYPGRILFSGLALNDQSIGAILVWSVGGLIYTWTAVILLRDWLAGEDQKPALPESMWATDDALAAPGLFSPPTSRP